MASGTSATLHALLLAAMRVDRPRVSSSTALRNALGVVLPLTLGLVMGQQQAGLALALGSLNVSFTDLPGPYPLRVRWMILASVVAGFSALVGSSTASTDWLAVPLTVAWGLGAGLLVALGPAGIQIGLTGIVLLVVYGGHPLPPNEAAITGALVFTGGAFQALLTAAAWSMRPTGPERDAVVAVLRSLAVYARAPSDTQLAPPLTGETTAARMMLSATALGSSGEPLQCLLDETERILLVLIALNDDQQRLRGEHSEAAIARLVGWVRSMAGAILEGLSETVAAERQSTRVAGQVQALGSAVGAARHLIANPIEAHTVALIETLVARLHAAVYTTSRLRRPGEGFHRGAVLLASPTFGIDNPLAILCANLTLRSAVCRHAVRLAVGLGVADALGRALGLPHAYWVPMTVALVLKPDFSATFVRGILRLVGTLLGLAVATELVHLVSGNVAVEVVICGVLVFANRWLADRNHGLGVTFMTALVVILLSLAGTDPVTTIADRGVATLVGGLLALALYSAWPTWERSQKPAILAELLDAYRGYFDAVVAGYLDAQSGATDRLGTLRLAARRARTNAEASIERLRGEPSRSEAELEQAVELLAASHRFVRATMALDANALGRRTPLAPAALQKLVGDIDVTLQAIAHRLRDPCRPSAALPKLRDDLQALTADLASEPIGADAAPERLQLDPFMVDVDRLVESADAMAHLVPRRDACQLGHADQP